MSLSLRNGMGMGAGGAPPYVTPSLPQADHIVRAWSMRRLISAYKAGNALLYERTDADLTDAETPAPFLKNGRILIPAGNDAFASVLYDQKGNNGTHASPLSELRQATFTACPMVFDNPSQLNGMGFDGGDYLAMATADSVLLPTFQGEFTIIA